MLESFKEYLRTYAANNEPDAAINREDWLNNAVSIYRIAMLESGYTLPTNVKVSCSWPKGRAKAIGQVFAMTCSKNKDFEICISPELDESTRVLDVLLHELCHILAGIDNGHRGKFKKCAEALGLTGSMRATTASDELNEVLEQGVIPNLGDYPHGQVKVASNSRKQTTRMIKATCPACGMVIRTTKKWIKEIGLGKCACDDETRFELEDDAENE